MLPVWLTLWFCSLMSALHTYQFALTNCLQQTEPVVLSKTWPQSKARHWTLHCLCCLMVSRVPSSVLSSWRPVCREVIQPSAFCFVASVPDMVPFFFLSTVWVMWAGPALGPSPHGAWTWVSFLIWLVLPIQPGLKTAVPVAVKLVFPHFSGSEALPQKLVTVLQNLRISQRFKSWCLQRSSRDLSCIISKGGGR